MTVDVQFDPDQVAQRLKTKVAEAQKALDAQVLADSNYFIPKDTGALEHSGIINTVIGSGLIKWRTPYARRQYYGVNFDHSKQHNPNACAKWFEAAKAKYIKKWRKLVHDYIKHN